MSDGRRLEVRAFVDSDGKLFFWFDHVSQHTAHRVGIDIERVEGHIMSQLPTEWLDRAEYCLPREDVRESLDIDAPRVGFVHVDDNDDHTVEVALDADAVDAMTESTRDRERGTWLAPDEDAHE